MTTTDRPAAPRLQVDTERLEAAWRALRAPVIPGRLIDIYRRGIGVCWLWLVVTWTLGYANWNPARPPSLWQADGIHLPWPETAWVPVWNPIPGLGMIWILAPIGLAALLLVLGTRYPRVLTGSLLFLVLWLAATDRFLFHYHRYLLVQMTAASLLLPPVRGDFRVDPACRGHVSHLDCLPVTGLAAVMWGWSAVAKLSWEWPELWAIQLSTFGPPVVDRAIVWLFLKLPPITTILVGSILTAGAELFVAYCLLRPAFTRAARRVGLLLAAGFGLMSAPFMLNVGLLTWVASRCVGFRAGCQPAATVPKLNLRNLLVGAFLVFHMVMPLRAYTSPGHPETHFGYIWSWRQMADIRYGRLTVKTFDPNRLAWRDLTGDWQAAHPNLVGNLVMQPCEIPWIINRMAENHPDLVPTDQPLELSLPPSDPPEAPVPAACADELPPYVMQAGLPR